MVNFLKFFFQKILMRRLWFVPPKFWVTDRLWAPHSLLMLSNTENKDALWMRLWLIAFPLGHDHLSIFLDLFGLHRIGCQKAAQIAHDATTNWFDNCQDFAGRRKHTRFSSNGLCRRLQVAPCDVALNLGGGRSWSICRSQYFFYGVPNFST